jgi:SAM-dependent methyltransferase
MARDESSDRQSCPLCQTDSTSVLVDAVQDYEYGAPGDYTWRRCDECGLVRIDPMPSPEVLARAYPPDYHAYVPPSSALSRSVMARTLAATAAAMVKRLPAGGTILDVGCSNGALLAAIGRLGDYRLLGVEYNAKAAAEAQSRGIETWRGDLGDAPFEPESVDLVTLQHVLEHVFDPAATLDSVSNLLKPGGRVIGELPNIDCWDYQIFGRAWGGGHVPRHLWHFTPKTLRRLLERAGFADVVIRPALHTGHWALSIQNWLRGPRRDTSGLRSGRAWYFPLLLLATIPINSIQMPMMKTGVIRFEATRK